MKIWSTTRYFSIWTYVLGKLHTIHPKKEIIRIKIFEEVGCKTRSFHSIANLRNQENLWPRPCFRMIKRTLAQNVSLFRTSGGKTLRTHSSLKFCTNYVAAWIGLIGSNWPFRRCVHWHYVGCLCNWTANCMIRTFKPRAPAASWLLINSIYLTISGKAWKLRTRCYHQLLQKRSINYRRTSLYLPFPLIRKEGSSSGSARGGNYRAPPYPLSGWQEETWGW